MDQLERDLRAALDDHRLAVPLRPDAGNLIRAGVRRRRRNRIVASVAGVVVLATGIGVGAASIGRGGGTQGVVPPANTTPTPTSSKPPLPKPITDEVPWAATTYDYHHPPAFPGAVADPSVPWCRASQLSLSQQVQSAGLDLALAATVTNTSPTTCALQGQPGVTVYAGSRSLVSSTPETFYVNQWVRLVPQANAHVGLTWSPDCGPGTPTRITFALPHAGGALSAPLTRAPACNSLNRGGDTGQLDVDGFVSRPGTPFTPLAGLTGSVDRTTASVYPGGVVSYRLQLQSTHAPQVALKPCLPYRERLVNTATGAVHEELHLLNCPAAPATIADAPSNRVTYFDLQIAVPTDEPAGSYALIWQSVLKPVNAVPDTNIRIGAAAPACRDGQIAASSGTSGAAAGTYVQTIVLHNTSSSICSLSGYPGVRLVDSSGRALGSDASRGGGPAMTNGAPTTVVLAADGGTASFTFAGPDYDNAAQQPCPVSAAALVFPPGMRQQLRVTVAAPQCPQGITTSPVVAGVQGATP